MRDLVGALGNDVAGQVARGDGVGHIDGAIERTHDGAGQEEAQGDGDDDAGDGEAHGQGCRRLERGGGLVGIVLGVAHLPLHHRVDGGGERADGIGKGAEEQDGGAERVAHLLGLDHLGQVAEGGVVLLEHGRGQLVESAALLVVEQRRRELEILPGFLVVAPGVGQQLVAGLLVGREDRRLHRTTGGDHGVLGAGGELEAGEILVVGQLRPRVHPRGTDVADNTGGGADEGSENEGTDKPLVDRDAVEHDGISWQYG